MICEDQ